MKRLPFYVAVVGCAALVFGWTFVRHSEILTTTKTPVSVVAIQREAKALSASLGQTQNVSSKHEGEPSPSVAVGGVPSVSVEVSVLGAGVLLSKAQVTLHVADVNERYCGELLTGEEGTARFDGLAEGRYRLSVIHPSFAPQEQIVLVMTSASHFEVYLIQGAKIMGKVIDRRDIPVAGVTIRALLRESTDEFGVAETNAQGEFELDALPLTTLRLYVHSGKHHPKFLEPVNCVAPGQIQHMVVRLEDSNELRGQIVTSDGRPVIGAHVGCSDVGSAAVESKVDGGFELLGIGDQPVNLYATARGFGPAHLRGVVPNASGVVLIMEPASRMVGNVVAEAQVDGFEVGLYKYDPFFEKEICVAAAVGAAPQQEFELKGLSPGEYVLQVMSDGHVPVRRSVRVLPGQTIDEGTIALKKDQVSRGQIHER